MASDIELLTLLDLAHGAENLVVIDLYLLEVCLGEGVLVLRMNGGF